MDPGMEKEVPKVADLKDLAAGRLPIYKGACIFRNLLNHLPSWYRQIPMGDIPLYYLIGQHGKIGYIPEEMSAYRIHEEGIYMGKSTAEKRAMNLRTRMLIYDHADEFKVDFRKPLLERLKKDAYLTSKYFYFEGNKEAGAHYHRLFLELTNTDITYLPYRLKLFLHYLGYLHNRKYREIAQQIDAS